MPDMCMYAQDPGAGGQGKGERGSWCDETLSRLCFSLSCAHVCSLSIKKTLTTSTFVHLEHCPLVSSYHTVRSPSHTERAHGKLRWSNSQCQMSSQLTTSTSASLYVCTTLEGLAQQSLQMTGTLAAVIWSGSLQLYPICPQNHEK